MPSYSRNEIVLIRFPFSDLSDFKIRPAVVLNALHPSTDLFLLPLTSRLSRLLPGEFVLNDWKSAGLRVPSSTKRGIFTINQKLVLQSVGKLSDTDVAELDESLRDWLELK